MKRITSCLFIFLLYHAANVEAQTLQGTITGRNTQKPIREATISLTSSSLSVISDYQGQFSLSPLREGVNLIQISHPQFESVSLEVVYTPGKDLAPRKIGLEPSVRLLHKDVVITAQRHEKDPFRTAESISTFNQQSFQQLNPGSLGEALMNVPGLWIQQVGAGQSAPVLRGLVGNRILLMVDGIRLNNSIYGIGPNPYLSTIDPLSISHLEVIRGSGSVQYGSDALGGTLQAFTPSPAFASQGFKVHGNANFRYMNRGQGNSIGGNVRLLGTRAALSVGHSRRKWGDQVVGGGQAISPTGYTEVNHDLKARFRLHRQHQLTLAYQQVSQQEVPAYDRLRTGDFIQYQHETRQRQLAYARLVSFYDSPWIKQIKITGSYQRAFERTAIQPKEVDFIRREENTVDTWGGALEIHSQPNLYWNVVSGIEFYHDHVGSQANEMNPGGEMTAAKSPFLDGGQMANLGIYSLHTLEILKLQLSFGGRANAFLIQAPNPEFGQEQLQPRALVGNISALYPLTRHVHLTSSFHTGFRAPQISDLSSYGPSYQGYEVPADSLNPEKSFTSQVGLKAKTDHFSGSLVFYRTQLTDLIETLPGRFQGSPIYQGQPVLQKLNFSQGFVQGFEAALEVPFSPGLAFYGSLMYTTGRNHTRDEYLAYIPPLNSRLGLRLRTKRGIWSRVEWMRASTQDKLSPSEQQDPFQDPDGTPGWNLLNLHIGYDFSWGYATFGIQNILDENYLLHGSSVQGPGRVVLFSMQLGF